MPREEVPDTAAIKPPPFDEKVVNSKEEAEPSKKRKLEDYDDPYDRDYSDSGSNEEYESDGLVNKHNEKDYISKLLNKHDTHQIFKNGVYRCPFDTKPKDGKRFSLVQHAEKLATTSHCPRERVNHKAILKVLFPNDEA